MIHRVSYQLFAVAVLLNITFSQAQALPIPNISNGDYVRFQLRTVVAGVERCIAPQAVAQDSDEFDSRLAVTPDISCGPEKKYFWEISRNHKIISYAYKGEDEG